MYTHFLTEKKLKFYISYFPTYIPINYLCQTGGIYTMLKTYTNYTDIHKSLSSFSLRLKLPSSLPVSSSESESLDGSVSAVVGKS